MTTAKPTAISQPFSLGGTSTRRDPSLDVWVAVGASGAVSVDLHAFAYVAGRDLDIILGA